MTGELKWIPAQGDSVFIEGDSVSMLSGASVVNYGGRHARFVWKERGFPALPEASSYANTIVELVGDSEGMEWSFGRVRLPVAWPEQKGLDLLLNVQEDHIYRRGDIDLEKHAAEARKRKLLGALARGVLRSGVDKDHEWMLRPSPTPELLKRGLEAAEIILDELLAANDDLDGLYALADRLRIHRGWPVTQEPYEAPPWNVQLIENLVRSAMGLSVKKGKITGDIKTIGSDTLLAEVHVLPKDVEVPKLAGIDIPRLLGFKGER